MFSGVQKFRNLTYVLLAETTCEDFDQQVLKTFLESHGVYNQGAWRRECQLWRKHGQAIQYGRFCYFHIFPKPHS